MFEVKKKVLKREFKSALGTELKLSVAVNSDTHSPDKTATLNPSRGVLKRLTINAVRLNSHKK